jgi:hypothetical protein
MKKKGLTFAELRSFLIDLGFSEIVEPKRIAFTNPTTEMFFLFRIYRPKEMVHPRDILLFRRQLVDNGLIEESDLDRFLQKASA